MGRQDDLTSAVRRVLQKPKGYKVFYASGLNIKDVRLMVSKLSDSERESAVQLFNSSFGADVGDLSKAEDDLLLAMFIALFDTASNVSHVANVYGGSDEVTAIIHESPLEEDEIRTVVSSNGNSIPQLSRNVNFELNTVSRGTYWAKNRRDGMYGEINRNSYSPMEYLTLVAVAAGGSSKILLRNKPLLANHSFIIDKDGNVKRQKYGEVNKFIDEEGQDHRAAQ